MSESHDTLVDRASGYIDTLMSVRRRALCSNPVHRDVSLPQLYILMTLRDRGPVAVSELANLMSISTPSASTIIDRMEEHALVLRVRDTEDRRVVHVELTEHGRRTVDELAGMKREQLQGFLGSMTDDELDAVIRGAQALQQALARFSNEAAKAEMPASA